MDQERRFGDIVPIPFKIAALLQIGVGFWYLLVWICHDFYLINILELLNLSYSPHNYGDTGDRMPTGVGATTSPADPKENYILLAGIRLTFRRLLVANCVLFVNCKVLLYFISGDGDQKKDHFVQGLYYVFSLASLLLTMGVIFHSTTNARSLGQFRVHSSLKRIMLGGINSSSMRTNDILISDTLTSYSKVLNDCVLYFWKVVFSSSHPYDPKVEFVVLIIPTFIRMKQCWHEYKRTGSNHHMLNLVKYSTAIGPLFINVLIKLTLAAPDNMEDLQKQAILKHLSYLNRWWYVLSTLNSAYTFVWDIKMDWGFQLFDSLFGSRPYVATRPSRQLYFRSHLFYYFAIVEDLVLRFLWVLKLFIVHENEKAGYAHLVGAFLFGSDALSFGYTLVEFLEVFRRWIWCLLKLESDWSKVQDSAILLELRPFQTKV